MPDYAKMAAEAANDELRRRAELAATWGMTREIATWAEKVALLEERIRELSAEIERLANELARKYE